MNNTEILQISVGDLRRMVDEMVEEKLAVLFHDAEANLEFTDELKDRLARQTKEIENGERGESLEEIAARLELN